MNTYPFGKRTTVSGSYNADVGFAGYHYHAPSGLNLTLYRAYDPVQARWLSRDPIFEMGGLNLYGYVGGRPGELRDPLGLNPLILVFGGGAALETATTLVTAAVAAADVYLLGDLAYQWARRNPLQAPPGPMPYPTTPPDAPPAPDWVWKGRGVPGSCRGNWWKPSTEETLHPDLTHEPPIGPHWDYWNPEGVKHRLFPDGTWEVAK